jgi:hypothetical protein
MRWRRVGLLAVGIFVLNVIARFITWKFTVVEASDQQTIGLVAVTAVAALLLGAGVWWAIRYPFSRLVFDLGAAVGVGALLSLLIGPFAGGSTPFSEGLGTFVSELLMFLGIAAVAALLGFLIVVTLGKDWKSRGLRRYEQNYRKRPQRTARG